MIDEEEELAAEDAEIRENLKGSGMGNRLCNVIFNSSSVPSANSAAKIPRISYNHVGQTSICNR